MQANPLAQRDPSAGPDLVQLVGLALLYFVAGRLGLAFADIHSSASAVWPPTGIALAAMLVYGAGAWPAIFAGALLVNLTISGAIASSLAIAAGNTAEALVGAWLVGRWARGAACFERVGDVFRFAGLAAGLATMLSATVGVGALVLAGQASAAASGGIWLTWWLGDAAGALTFAPPLVLWYRNRRVDFAHGRMVEAVLTLALVIAVAVLCFASPVLSGYPLMFLCLPPLAWVALRFGRRAAATHVVLLSLIAVYTTQHGVGPFVMATRHESLLVLQAFMGTIALTMLPMAALMAEYRRASAELEAAHAQERRARAEAEAASAAKDEFLAMLSHELRNPLQAIASSVWLLERPPAGGADRPRRALEILRRQTEHLTRLVNDLLDVARVTSGRMPIVAQPLNLADAVRRTVNALDAAGRLEEHRVEVVAEPLWLRADPARLDQMLSNLVVNAVKYSPQGSRVRIAVGHDGDEALVRVSDDGAGIAAELLPRVFEVFSQGRRGLDRSEGGLGVGLALVQRLAQLHGGSVEARSDGQGRGSEFVLRLPLLARPVEGARRAQAATGPRRVLIVEDNADVREALRTLLEHTGHVVYEAEDGQAGIDAALRLKPDVVLIDIGLPRLDGYQVARQLRARREALGGDVRLVAVTGYGQAEDRRRAREAGFDEHLVKPVDPEALQRALGQAAAPAVQEELKEV